MSQFRLCWPPEVKGNFPTQGNWNESLDRAKMVAKIWQYKYGFELNDQKHNVYRPNRQNRNKYYGQWNQGNLLSVSKVKICIWH